MGNRKKIITRENINEFNNTNNGKKKLLWLKIGVVIDILSTLSISLLNIFSVYLKSSFQYYFILYIILVIVVVGGEFIGTYFGALEQYVINKYGKKIINYKDN